MAAPNYAPVYQQAGAAYDVDPTLLAALNQVESGGDPNAVSSDGAQGNMQLMPTTASRLGVTNPNDPVQAIYGAAKLISQNLHATGGKVGPAVAMYFAGPNKSEWGPKTHAYLPAVSAAYQKLKAQTVAQPVSQQPISLDDLAASAQEVPAGAPAAPSSNAPVTLDDLQASTVVPPVAAGQDGNVIGTITGPQAAARPIAAGIVNAANAAVSNPIAQGIMRGAHVVTDAPAEALASGADKIGLTGLLNKFGLNLPTGTQVAASDANEQANYRAQYGGNPVAQGINFGTQAAMVLPTLESGVGALRAGGNALVPEMGDFITGNPQSGNLLTKGLSLAAGGALSGAGSAAATAAGSDQPVGRQIEAGAEGGALAGPVAGLAGAGANKLLGGAGIDPYTAALAQKALGMGIPLRAGQIATNPLLRVADDVVSRLPGSGAAGQAEVAQTAFNRNVASTMGATADRITPDVMAATKARLGQEFNDVAAKTTIIPDQQFAADLGRIHADAGNVLAPSEMTPVKNQIGNVISALNKGNGQISGDQYQVLTRTGAPLDRAMQSGDPNVRFYAGQVKDALDSVMQRSAPPEVQAQLTTARSQYKAMKTIEDLVEKAPTGNISPSLLMGAVRNSYGNMAYNGGGTLGDLARIGQQFLKPPPNSGTPERLAILSALGGGGGAGIADLIRDPMQGALLAGGAASVPIIARGANMALNNKFTRNALIARALGQTSGPTVNALTTAAAQPTGNVLRPSSQ